MQELKFQKYATSGSRGLFEDNPIKVSTWSIQCIFYNPVHQFPKHSYEKNAFKVRKHQIALVKKLMCKMEEWINF